MAKQELKSLSNQTITGPAGWWVRETFFYLGLVGAVGLRLVLILNNYNPFYARLSWYIAMISLSLFYYYRLWIENRRRALILEADLINKLNENNLSADDREKVATLLSSTIVSKQRLNLNILFLASIVVLALQIAMDYKLF